MTITVHRGTGQIGGCITEYELNGWKVFVDFGEQLPGQPVPAKPLQIEGLNCGDTSRSALLITHYHGDHIGKLAEADPAVKVFMGAAALEIYMKLQGRLARINGPAGDVAKASLERYKKIHTFRDGEKFSFGPFIIEPVKVDHSAFDAYGFVIENKDNDEDIAFHTGDFRNHGIFGEEFYNRISSLPPVKALLCEATNIERDNATEMSEHAVEKRFSELFAQHKYNAVFVSSTNIDRLFGIYRAACNAGRVVLMDEYQFDILKTVIGESDSLNNDLDYITVIDGHGDEQSVAIESFYSFDKGTPFVLRYDYVYQKEPRFFVPERLRMLIESKGCVLLARATPQFARLIDSFPASQCRKYLSMWKGYIEPQSPAFNQKLSDAIGDAFEYVHTSGHASPGQIEELLRNVDAEFIIPMHTSNPKRFLEHFPENEWQIRLLADGEKFCLDKESYRPEDID